MLIRRKKKEKGRKKKERKKKERKKEVTAHSQFLHDFYSECLRPERRKKEEEKERRKKKKKKEERKKKERKKKEGKKEKRKKKPLFHISFSTGYPLTRSTTQIITPRPRSPLCLPYFTSRGHSQPLLGPIPLRPLLGRVRQRIPYSRVLSRYDAYPIPG